MNVHGTHASAGPAASVGTQAAPSKVHNDCQIQAAEFARMLTQLMDKPAEPSVNGTGPADAPGAPTVKSER